MTESPKSDAPKPVPPRIGEEGEHPVSVLLFSWMRGELFDRVFLAGLSALCVLLAALELVIHRHDGGGFESLPVFQGVFGFLAFALAVLSGWPLGRLMRRPENYYGDLPQEEPAGTPDDGSASDGEASHDG